MAESSTSERIEALEMKLTELTAGLAQARGIVQQWNETGASLSRSAAEARAENQGAGRGFFGALFGSKFRSAVRSGAAASNAAIAKDVAAKRSKIAEGKQQAQEAVRRMQAEIALVKDELKMLRSSASQRARRDKTKSAADSLDLLQKLKQARDAGLLTEQEFDEKRKKLLSDL